MEDRRRARRLAAARPVRRLGRHRRRIFGLQSLGGVGGVTFAAQLVGTLTGIANRPGGGGAVYGLLKLTIGIRLDAEEEFNGADLSIHKIRRRPSAKPTGEAPGLPHRVAVRFQAGAGSAPEVRAAGVARG